MRNDLASKVQAWASLIDIMPRCDEELEFSTMLVLRDDIHNDLKAGTPISPEMKNLLKEADNRLLAMGDLLAHRFPEVFEGRAPREYWWWHLDEGPQVRERAKAYRDVA